MVNSISYFCMCIHQVDLTTMYMTKPFSGKLRRTKRPALWLHYRHSLHYCYISTHLHRLQVHSSLSNIVGSFLSNTVGSFLSVFIKTFDFQD